MTLPGRGDGQVVSVFAFYSKHPRLNPAEAYTVFSVKFVFERTKINKIETGVCPLKHVTLLKCPTVDFAKKKTHDTKTKIRRNCQFFKNVFTLTLFIFFLSLKNWGTFFGRIGNPNHSIRLAVKGPQT